jgi:hypothetical protein
MKYILFISIVLSVLLGLANQLMAQPDLNGENNLPVIFNADWISCPDDNPHEYGVYHLRKVFELTEKPSRFIIHVSGDHRYRLFVNGKQVCQGPARGDLRNWKYETLDIASFLNAGNNVLAAQLWNMGSGAPAAQISYQTGFILQGTGDAEKLVNTNESWRIIRNEGYFPEVIPPTQVASYIVGSCDSVVFSKYPWGWQQLGYDDSLWKKPVKESKGKYFNEKRILIPRDIPFLEEKKEPISGLVRVSGVDLNELKSKGDSALYIPANTTAEILFDRETLTTAYPEITFSGGSNSLVRITYAESLFDDKNLKGNRNQTVGKKIKGYYDVFLPDGSTTEHLFKPLWIRTFRYLQLNITTPGEPLLINKMQSVFTAYPLREVGHFTSDDKSLDKIWEVGWRTARLCAGETYMDCPYYEQLQYIGDTRIQALISLYVSGDDRLMRNAIEQFHQSQIPDGLTKDAYPCGSSKIITPFSLFWVSMIHDFCWYRNDKAFIEKYLIPMEAVLKWFEFRLDPKTGLLGKLGYWNFVDWSFPKVGVPLSGLEGQSSVLSLQYVYTLEQSIQVFELFNQSEKATYYKQVAEKIKKAVVSSCFDTKRMLLADTPKKKNFSQHANIWSILTGCIPEKEYQATMEKIISDSGLTQASIYYRFYYTKALKKSGLGNRYLSELGPWKEMIDLGLSTFPETTSPTTRSDCHAWSSSPCYDFLATVCGIEPEDFGFRSVRIEPNPGKLTNFEGSVPHPLGIIKVRCRKQADGHYLLIIELPQNLTGHLVWNGKTSKLKSGSQTIRF